MELFDTLNREGNTIILVTHEEDIANRAKRIVSCATAGSWTTTGPRLGRPRPPRRLMDDRPTLTVARADLEAVGALGPDHRMTARVL